MDRLEKLEAGAPILYGGDRVTYVSDELAAAFAPGDAVVVVQETGEVLHVPEAERLAGQAAVDRAVEAFSRMGEVSDEQITGFYEHFAAALEDDPAFAPIAAANAADAERARDRGRSTTRLVLSDAMRADMVE
ncbi:MAG: aldehyde dehydrogenase family protein, partial [Nitriliruptorales bacterium]